MKKNEMLPEQEGADKAKLSVENLDAFIGELKQLKEKEQEEAENSKESKGGENREGKDED